MPHVEKLLIFLASPSDVSRERRYVQEVVDEINRTVAPAKRVVLEVVRWETHTFPGYGKDPQALVNAQIAVMSQHALFIGLMWNRIGTATPRAESGTVEEFNRAATALRRKGRPEIWFYFKQASSNMTSEDQLEQKKKVLRFRKRVQARGLTCDFTRPQEFRDQFRNQLSLWLNKRKVTTPRSLPTRAASTRKGQPSGAPARTASPARPALEGKGQKLTAAAGRATAASASRSRQAEPPVARRTVKQVSGSSAWMMLGNSFFLTQTMSHDVDGTIRVRIKPRDAAQEAVLRALDPGKYRRQEQIAYAYQNGAAHVEVVSVTSESIKGATVFLLTLKVDERWLDGRMIEMSVDGYSADAIAEQRARLLLLNEAPPDEGKRFFSTVMSFIAGSGAPVRVEKSVFPDLWKQFRTQPQQFLRLARLAAVYHLKASGTVEHVLDLALGPIQGRMMAVRFSGQRKQVAGNVDPTVIKVTGTCPLAPSAPKKRS